MKRNFVNKTKIFTAIFLSLIVVNVLSPRVFLGSTPHLNPVLVQNLLNTPRDFIARMNGSAGNVTDPGLGNPTNEEIPANAVVRVIAPGVMAAETEEATYLTVTQGTKLNIKTVKLPDGTEIDVISR